MGIKDFLNKSYQYQKPIENYFKIESENNNHYIIFENKKYEVIDMEDRESQSRINDIEELAKIVEIFNECFNNHASIEISKGTIETFTFCQFKNQNFEEKYNHFNNNENTHEFDDDNFNNFNNFSNFNNLNNKPQNYIQNINVIKNVFNNKEKSQIIILENGHPIEEEEEEIISNNNINNISKLTGSFFDINIDENNTVKGLLHFEQINRYTKFVYVTQEMIHFENPLAFSDIQLRKVKKAHRFPFLAKIHKIFKQIIRFLFVKTPITDIITKQINHLSSYYTPEVDQSTIDNLNVGDEIKFFRFLADIEFFIDLRKNRLNERTAHLSYSYRRLCSCTG